MWLNVVEMSRSQLGSGHEVLKRLANRVESGHEMVEMSWG